MISMQKVARGNNTFMSRIQHNQSNYKMFVPIVTFLLHLQSLEETFVSKQHPLNFFIVFV